MTTRPKDYTPLSRLAGRKLLDVTCDETIDAEGDAALAAFTLFSDIIERLDTVLMEIRHLQTNLIYFMRAPELHAALRYEESYIFGSYTDRSGKQKDWSKLFGHSETRNSGQVVSLDTLPRLADAFVPFLPVANDEYGFDLTDGDLKAKRGDRAFPDLHNILHVKDEWREVVAPIVRTLRRRRATGQEDDNYASSYHVFVALQGIKRNVVYDKLHVVWYGLRAFYGTARADLPCIRTTPMQVRRQTQTAEKRADFAIARAIAMGNIHEHITGMLDFRTFFENQVDTGVQDNHRPIISRRREQGMYQFMLGEQARDFYIEASRLIQSLTSNAAGGNIYRGLPIFVHRWSHHATSENRAIPAFSRMQRLNDYTMDERRDDATYVKESQSYTAFTVNTSFFTPDRPDLQPIIAHEAVHCVLLELFDQMETSNPRLNDAGDFATFWRNLKNAEPDIERLYDPGLGDNSALMRELTVDTITIGITGVGYLYALFQELCGYDLDKLIPSENARGWTDLAALAQKLQARAIYPELSLQWYWRLRLCCHVMEKTLIPKYEKSVYVEELIDGIRQTIDDMLVRLSIIHSEKASTPPETGESDKTKKSYTMSQKVIEIGRMICDAADRSGVCEHIRRIREAQYTQSSGVVSQRQEQPNRHAIFADETRARLIEFYIERKLANYERPLHKAIEAIGPSAKECATSQTIDLERLTKSPQQQLHNARTDRESAINAAIAFADLYLHGEKYEENSRKARRVEKSHILSTYPKRRWYQPVKRGKHPISNEAQKAELFREMLSNFPCFVRLSDVAWQTSFFRSAEMAAQLRGTNNDPIVTLSKDFAPGREVLQLAIEIWGFDRRLSIGSLSEATRLQMNILRMPVGASTNWRPPQTDSIESQPLLERVCKVVLPSDDNTTMAGDLRELAMQWEAHGGKTLPNQTRTLAEDIETQQKTPEEARSALVEIIEQSICAWLGSDLDADFFEVEALGMFQDAVDIYNKRCKSSAPEDVAHVEAVGALNARLLHQDFIDRILDQMGEIVLEPNTDPAHKHDYVLTDKDARTIRENLYRLITSLEKYHQVPDTLKNEDAKKDVDTLLQTLKRYYDALPDPSDTAVFRAATHRAMLEVVKQIIKTPAIVVRPDFRVSIANSLTIHPDQSELRRLSQSPGARTLIDDCIQGLRLFEIPFLAERMETFRKTRNFDGYADFARSMGALQVLKLDPGYPHIVFPIQPERKRPWDLDDLKKIDALKRDEALRTCNPVAAFLTDENSMPAAERAPARARALVAISAFTLLYERLCRMKQLHEMAFEAGCTFIKEAGDRTLPQRHTQPITPRLHKDIDYARQVNALAHHKLEVLRCSLAPEKLKVQELAPLLALATQAEASREDVSDNREAASDVVRETYRALSRSGKGLKVFRTLYLSRQSLVDTHWWRETNQKEPDIAEAGEDDRNAINERLHGAFYHEVPHNAGNYAKDDKDLPEPPSLRRFVTLGRYDFFNFSNSVVFGQQRLPLMDRRLGQMAADIFNQPEDPYSKVKHERLYRAFFMRGEFALAMSLLGEPVNITAPNLVHRHAGTETQKDVLAIISLRLDRRSSRLGFFHRLRGAARDWADYNAAAAKLAMDGADDLHTPDTVITQIAKDPALEGNRYLNASFRRSIAQALHRAVIYRAGDDPELSPIESAMKAMLDPQQPMHHPTYALRSATRARLSQRGLPPIDSRPTQLGLMLDAARHFGDLPNLAIDAAGAFIQPGDAVYLGEGWGDLYVVLFCDKRPLTTDKESHIWAAQGVRRLYDAFALQHALFQDYSVYRTETFFRPSALPFAALDPDRIQLGISVRSREDREIDGVVQRTLRAARTQIARHIDVAGSETRDISINHVPGRNDFEFLLDGFNRIRSPNDPGVLPHMLPPTKILELLHEIVGAGEADIGSGTEEVLTRISFRHAITPAGS